MTLTPEQLDRYSRHILLKEIGGQGQQKLLGARVLVVGAGGIGAPAILYLAAAGVGTIGIADDDAVALSNLQRQVIFTTEDLARPKTEAARAGAEMLNPGVRIEEHRIRIDADNARDVVSNYDLVLEGIDNFEGRFALNAACIAARRPLVSAAVGRFRGQLSVFKPYERPGELPCYRCFLPETPPGIETCEAEGVLGAVPGVIGTMAALEAIKEILGLGQSLAGRILLYDALRSETRTARLAADPQCPACGRLKETAHAAE